MNANELSLSLINHTPTAETQAQIERVRADAKTLGLTILRETPPSREQSLAITNLEQAVMWAVKSAVIPRQETLC